MLVPTSRLLLVTATVALPLATVGGMYPGAMPVCAAALAVCVAAAAVDAIAALRRADAVSLRTPPYIRLTKDVAATFPVVGGARFSLPVRLGVNLPPGVETD